MRNVLILLTVLNSSAITAAQDSTDTWNLVSLDWWNTSYMDARHVVTSPLRWDAGDWITGAVVAVTCANIMQGDGEVHDWVQTRRDSTMDVISSGIGLLGAEGAIGIFGGLYLGGCLTHNVKLKRISLLCGESAAISGVIAVVGKHLIGRSRPYQGEGPDDYHPFSFGSGSHSFPSGHTCTAFSIASCLTEEYDSPLVGVASYLTAFLVGLSRINDNKHWASDVFVGSLLGISVGRTVVKLRRKKRDENSFNWRFVPCGFPTGDFTG
jgi:membrane-associated phospholipid phosphatase